MGAGKTTLGKALAKKINASFVDLDWYLEEHFHKTINQLFTEYGENNFRALEKKALHEVAEFENVVIATGGGTPCFFDNMQYMNKRGMTVYIDVQINVLFERLKVAMQNRPVIREKKDNELLAFIVDSLNSRLSFYRQAEFIFNGNKLETNEQISTSVVKLQQLLNITN